MDEEYYRNIFTVSVLTLVTKNEGQFYEIQNFFDSDYCETLKAEFISSYAFYALCQVHFVKSTAVAPYVCLSVRLSAV